MLAGQLRSRAHRPADQGAHKLLTLCCTRAARLTALHWQDIKEKISQRYRVRLILDNLPVTAYDLADSPESIRPGFELGYEADGKFYVNNHLSFTILYHRTNGQYTRAQMDLAEIEAASVVEVRSPVCSPACEK